jgi:hypothetical protein
MGGKLRSLLREQGASASPSQISGIAALQNRQKALTRALHR